MPTLLLSDPVPEEFIARIRQAVPDGLVISAPSDPKTFAQEAASADVVLALGRRIDAEFLRAAPNVRFVQTIGAGYDSVDVEALAAAGVLGANAAGANAFAVAEHTIMFMLLLVKQFPRAERSTRTNHWPMIELTQAGIGELFGATIGLVGFGHIARAVAERLLPFGARILYSSRRRAEPVVEERLRARHVELGELLKSSKIVSLHVPLTEDTRGMIGEPELGAMPAGSFLINTARGGIVDEAALRNAVLSGHLGGAGLDVIHAEEDGGNPFTDVPNIIVTPHSAGSSQASLSNMMQVALENIGRFLTGRTPKNILPGLEP